MLTILIPAFNEENILEISVNKIFKKLYQFENEFQVLVINNNSNDETENLCLSLQRKYDKFFFINEPLQGKGNAVKSGLKNALYNNILILDADLSVSIDQFDINWIQKNNTNICLNGSRYKGEVIGSPLQRSVSGKIFSFIVKMLFDLPVDDTQCGFKFISYSEPKKIAEKMTVGNFAYDIDLLLVLKNLNVEIQEVPVTYIHNNDSAVNIFKDSFKMIVSLIKLKKNY